MLKFRLLIVIRCSYTRDLNKSVMVSWELDLGYWGQYWSIRVLLLTPRQHTFIAGICTCLEIFLTFCFNLCSINCATVTSSPHTMTTNILQSV